MTDTELKPCPFCGRNAVISPNNSYTDERQVFTISCSATDDDECDVTPVTTDFYREHLRLWVDKWNTRA